MIRRVWIFIGAVLVCAVLVVGWVLLKPTGGVNRPLPSPNGYDDFVRAARGRGGEAVDSANSSEEQLRALVDREADTIKLIHAGFGKECRVALEYTSNYAQSHLADLSGQKGLAILLTSEGRLAELTNNPARAAEIYLDAVRFGHEVCRGGVMIDRLVGMACENMGLKRLEALIGGTTKLTPAQCGELAKQLQAIDARAESAEEVLKQERDWSDRSFGWRGRWLRMIRPGLMKPGEQKFIQKARQTEADRRRVLAALAEKGKGN